MGFFKVLGFVAAGVGAVVAAPVLIAAAPVAALGAAAAGAASAAGAAAAGAATAAGAAAAATAASATAAAAGAATVGAAAVGAVATTEVAAAGLVAGVAGVARANAKGRREEEIKEAAYKAGAAAMEAKHQKKFEDLMGKLAEHQNLEKSVLAMFALGVAVASLDGEISQSEKDEIEMFIAGVALAKFPESVLVEVRRMYDSPPSVGKAMEYVAAAGVSRAQVNEMIGLIVESDGEVTDDEKHFQANWQRYLQVA